MDDFKNDYKGDFDQNNKRSGRMNQGDGFQRQDYAPASTNQTPKHRRWAGDWKVVIILLLALATGYLLADKYHNQASSGEERTIAVSGESTIKATPDEYVFYPNYNFKNADKTAALDELTKKSDQVVAELKKLGVEDNKIKTSSSGGDYGPIYYDGGANKDAVYSLSLTVTVGDSKLAQKVQDYLATTQPTGQVSPQAAFSDSKRKQLEGQARDEATKEARDKAEQSAKNLGFKVGIVKTVEDGSGFGGMQPYASRAMGAATDAVAPEAASTAPKLVVQPGENSLSYTVNVVYTIK